MAAEKPEPGLCRHDNADERLAKYGFRNDAVLATHDPKLLQHPLLNEHRWRFGDEPAPALPAPLQALYQDSLAFVYRGWSHA